MSRATDHLSADAAPDSATDRSPTDSVDVGALAEKVYRLMLTEARLELARGARWPRDRD